MGNNWVKLFLKRNETLCLRIGKSIKRVRAVLSRPVLNVYFKNLIKIIKNIPSNTIFNYKIYTFDK